jgi:hypothetical protein
MPCCLQAYHADVLFDQYLLDKVINLLIALNTWVQTFFTGWKPCTLLAFHLARTFSSTAEKQ